MSETRALTQAELFRTGAKAWEENGYCIDMYLATRGEEVMLSYGMIYRLGITEELKKLSTHWMMKPGYSAMTFFVTKQARPVFEEVLAVARAMFGAKHE